MTLDVQQFTRKSFAVDAVQITADNMEEVARWCQAEIHESEPDDTLGERYIQVRVLNPLTTRQTRGYVGDWVLYAGKGYKVYTDKGMKRSFDPKAKPVAQNVFTVDEAKAETLSASGTSGATNPGGTHGH